MHYVLTEPRSGVARSLAVAAWSVGVVWLALVAWCGQRIATVVRYRAEVEPAIQWMADTEGLRRAAVDVVRDAELQIASAADGARFVVPSSFRETLTEACPVRTTPAGAEHGAAIARACRGVVEALDGVDGEILSGHAHRGSAFRVRALRDRVNELDAAVAGATQFVRASLGDAAAGLNREWTSLYVLAGLSIAAIGALVVLIRRWRRKIVEIAVKERHFRALVQTAQDLIWSTDAEGRWTFLNDAARRIYGYAPEEMLGRPFVEFLAPDRVEKDVAAFRGILEGKPVRDYETVHVAKDGTQLTMLFRATRVCDARGRVLGSMGTATDITRTQQMQEQIVQSERLQAAATLGGGVAHDFNNLLTVIIGQVEVAKAKGDLSAPVQRRLNSILETAGRARKLTQQLIAFARRQPLRREVIDLVAVVRQIGELTRQLAGERVRVQEVLPTHAVRMLGDWSQIEQVIINLVLNARDAMPEGGTVTLSVQHRAVARNEAATRGLDPGNYAVLEVTDSGLGIPPEILGRIFDPFFTTKEPGKGTGLGLATVHGVVNQHGGAVVASSAPGGGTCVQVFLPATPEPTAAAPAPADALRDRVAH